MAPLPDNELIKSYLSTLIKRTPTTQSTRLSFRGLSPKAAALAARAIDLVPRGTAPNQVNPGAGVTPPQKVPNKVIFILFGLIGVGFIVTGIWFFFWAKNGGFHFKENDWEEYKSTVLRRKGPNGTTLSGATATTDLGGGSIVHGEKTSKWRRLKKSRKGSGGTRYKDFDDEGTLAGSARDSALSSEMGDLKYDDIVGRRAKKEKKSRRTRSEVGDDAVADELRAYRHERPARVGGLNKESDSSAFDGSTVDNSTAASELLYNRESTPTNTPTKVRKEKRDSYTGGTGGIRKVESQSTPGTSFWNRATGSAKKKNEQEERIQAEARKLQEKGRAARRDFSFQTGDDGSSGVGGDEDEARSRREARRERRASRSPTKNVPGSYYEDSVVGSDLSGDIGGTKSYHHPIPGLSSSEYAEERRKRRTERGYRREDH